MTENTVAEPTVEPTVASVPPLASLDQADTMTQMAATLTKRAADNLNDVQNRNSASSKGVDEILVNLRETSTDPKVQALREKIANLQEEADKVLLAEAKALKASAGEPDVEAEKAALKVYKANLEVLLSTVDGEKVLHLLPTVGKTHTPRTIGAGANAGPKRDLSEVRAWAKANGHADLGDRGRIPADIIDAYTKATGKQV